MLNLIKLIVKTIFFYHIIGSEMLNSTKKFRNHLNKLSEEDKDSIREEIKGFADTTMYPFSVDVNKKFLYFLQNEELVCMNLEEENGVYYFWFDNRFIQVKIASGDCIIIDFNRNCIEYFCVTNFFQSKLMNTHYFFLYRLLMQEKIGCLNRNKISSLCIYFNPDRVFGHIQRIGKPSLKTPSGCLSIHEMIRAIELFITSRFSSCFMSNLNFFQKALLENCALPSQRPSVAGHYGVRMFLMSMFEKLPFFGMISEIMRRFVGKSMTGIYPKLFAKKFFKWMCDSICLKMIQMFIRDPIHLLKATDTIKELILSSSSRIKHECPGLPTTTHNCVSVMLRTNYSRLQDLDEKRKKWFDEAVRKDQEELQCKREREGEGELQKKRLRQEFKLEIEGIQEEVSHVNGRICRLDEFASGGIAIEETYEVKRRIDELDEFEKFE